MTDRKFRKGVISVSRDQGEYLRIGFPQWLITDLKKQGIPAKRFTSVGLKDTSSNRSRVESVVQIMNQDLENPYGGFDATLGRYLLMLKPNVSIHGKTTKLAGKPKISIGDCWDDWLEIKRKKLSSSTFTATYQKKYGRFIKQFRGLDVSEETAKKIVASLSGANDKAAANNFINQYFSVLGFSCKYLRHLRKINKLW